MVPAGEITEKTVAAVADRLQAGDTIIDGGNTHYHDDIRRAEELSARGIEYLDCGTSGGVFGLRARLLPDDRGSGGGLCAAGADLRLAGARGRGGGADSGARR